MNYSPFSPLFSEGIMNISISVDMQVTRYAKLHARRMALYLLGREFVKVSTLYIVWKMSPMCSPISTIWNSTAAIAPLCHFFVVKNLT